MIHQPEYVKELLRKYFEGTATPVEVARLMVAWDLYDDDELVDMIAEVNGGYKVADIDIPVAKNTAVENTTTNKLKRKQWKRARYGLIFCGLCIIALLYFFIKKEANLSDENFYCNDSRRAVELSTVAYSCQLLLADGSKKMVHGNDTGLIARQGNFEIVQHTPGLLEYRLSSGKNLAVSNTDNNSIAVPKGMQYRVKLPDGSEIRLNAGTAIKFYLKPPGAFALALQGEGLFDIVADNDKPFSVSTSNATLLLSKGRYNIKATLVDICFATVLDGEMEIKGNNERGRFKSGTQVMLYCEFSRNREVLKYRSADTGTIISWKSTTRRYINSPIWEFVTDMANWYNLEIKGMDCIPQQQKISVAVCQDMTVEELFSLLRKHGLKFTQQGNTIRFCDEGDVKMYAVK